MNVPVVSDRGLLELCARRQRHPRSQSSHSPRGARRAGMPRIERCICRSAAATRPLGDVMMTKTATASVPALLLAEACAPPGRPARDGQAATPTPRAQFSGSSESGPDTEAGEDRALERPDDDLLDLSGVRSVISVTACPSGPQAWRVSAAARLSVIRSTTRHARTRSQPVHRDGVARASPRWPSRLERHVHLRAHRGSVTLAGAGVFTRAWRARPVTGRHPGADDAVRRAGASR